MEKNTIALPGSLHLSEITVGSHLSYFYEKREDLFALVVDYCKDTVGKNEACLCICSEELLAEEIKNLVKNTELSDCISSGQIEIVSVKERLSAEIFDGGQINSWWIKSEEKAASKGFKALRVIYNTSWMEKDKWEDYLDWQNSLGKMLADNNIASLFTYALFWYNSVELFFGVLNCATKTIVRREGEWQVIPSPQVEVPTKGSSLYERYAVSVISLDKIFGELLPSGEGWQTTEQQSPKPAIPAHTEKRIVEALKEKTSVRRMRKRMRTRRRVMARRKKGATVPRSSKRR